MGYAALRIPDDTKKKYHRANAEYPRVPLSHMADAIVDGWWMLTPEQREQAVRSRPQFPRRGRKRLAASA